MSHLSHQNTTLKREYQNNNNLLQILNNFPTMLFLDILVQQVQSYGCYKLVVFIWTIIEQSQNVPEGISGSDLRDDKRPCELS